MNKPSRHAVALVVPAPAYGSRLLAVLRPDDDDELPGVWGLPAGSVRPGERPEVAALRVGQQKLGLRLRLGDALAVGEQERSAYRLTMTLFRADLVNGDPSLPLVAREDGVTYYTAWQWAGKEILEQGALRGSLCCQLCLQHYQVNVR